MDKLIPELKELRDELQEQELKSLAWQLSIQISRVETVVQARQAVEERLAERNREIDEFIRTLQACEDSRVRLMKAKEQAEAKLREAEQQRSLYKLALAELEQAEASYRRAHDLKGDGHIQTGRAWDLMRRAGQKARDALKREDH